MQKFKTYVVNLKERPDRKMHIIQEFSERPEFDVTIVSAIRDKIGSWGLWLTIKTIVKEARDKNYDYIIICEDDHIFTKDYDKISLSNLIENLKMNKADILLGGASWFDTALPISRNLFWVKKFHGLQFTVVFKSFYEKLLNMEMKKGNNADIKMSNYSDRSFVCYPYISFQKEFGYSDVTIRNSQKGYVSKIFENRMEKLKQLHEVATYYKKI